jgi:hypothetical protein
VLEPDSSGAFDSRQGYGTNKGAAKITLRESGLSVSILRSSRIHDPRPTARRAQQIPQFEGRSQERPSVSTGGPRADQLLHHLSD